MPYTPGMAVITGATEADVEDFIRQQTLPDGMKLVSIAFDEDHTGDPSARIVMSVPKKLNYSKAEVSSWTDFSNQIFEPIQAMTGRWPYFDTIERKLVTRKRSA